MITYIKIWLNMRINSWRLLHTETFELAELREWNHMPQQNLHQTSQRF